LHKQCGALDRFGRQHSDQDLTQDLPRRGVGWDQALDPRLLILILVLPDSLGDLTALLVMVHLLRPYSPPSQASC
jgi:hypothetical protein